MNVLNAATPPLGDFSTGLHPGYINAERARQACAPLHNQSVEPGDLIFFKDTYPTAGASHVGIVLDPGKRLMADDHARPDGTGPGETNYAEPYWASHFLEFRRVRR